MDLDGHSGLQKKERKLLASAVKEKEHSLGPLYRLEPLNKGHTGPSYIERRCPLCKSILLLD